MHLQQLNLIKLAFLNKKKTVTINNMQSTTKNIVICLLKNNYINNLITNNSKITIYLNLNKNNKNISLKNLYKPSQRKTITIKFLKKHYWVKTKNVYILSTNLGIITHHEAIKFNVGGTLLLKIFN